MVSDPVRAVDFGFLGLCSQAAADAAYQWRITGESRRAHRHGYSIEFKQISYLNVLSPIDKSRAVARKAGGILGGAISASPQPKASMFIGKQSVQSNLLTLDDISRLLQFVVAVADEGQWRRHSGTRLNLRHAREHLIVLYRLHRRQAP